MSSSKYHSSTEWKKVRAAYLATQPQPYVCSRCGKEGLAGNDLTVDHISAGHLGDGEFLYDNSHDNLQILCLSCNSGKGDGIKTTKIVRVDWVSEKWS